MTHGLSSDGNGKRSRLYHIWEDMKSRCLNANNKRYHRYGGRGISISFEWRSDYLEFYKWAMENGYDNELTLDRMDVNGNYEPSNCKWSTPKEQANNRSTNTVIEYNGESKSMSDWATMVGLEYHVLRNRIKRKWTIERALNTPTEKHNKRAA